MTKTIDELEAAGIVGAPRPCIGCGYCCGISVCALGQRAYEVGPEPPCPGLYFDGARCRCEPAETHPGELGIGAGCCSPLNSRRNELIAFEVQIHHRDRWQGLPGLCYRHRRDAEAELARLREWRPGRRFRMAELPAGRPVSG